MELLKLKDVCSVNSGISPPKDKKIFENGTVPFYKTLDVGRIKTGNICDSELKVSQEFADSKRVFEPGTILFPKSGASTLLNHRVMIQKKGLVASTLAAIVPIKDLCLSKYLFYYLLTIDTKDFIPESFYPGMKISEISEIPIPAPPLQEQEKIVEKLDKVYISKEKLSEKYSQASRLYADLKNSVLKQTFENLLTGNKLSLLGEITTVASGGTPKKSNVEYWNGEINWLSSGELENLYLDSSIKQISKLGLENSSAKIFPEGSLLVGMYDTAAFKMSIINSPMAFNQAICGILPDGKIDILFIYYQLQFLKNKILKQRVGVRQQNLNVSKMRNIEVVIPDLKIQKVTSKNIYKQFSYIDELSNINSNKNPKLQELVKSALRKEFSYE